MSYELHEQQIIELMNAVTESAKRGVNIIVQVDANSFLEDTQGRLGPLFWHGKLSEKMPKVWQTIYDSLNRLRDAGAEVVITNMPTHAFAGPMIGRSHIKTSVINDKVYIGGCNLSDMHLDIMAAWQDADTADWLFELMKRRIENPKTLQAFGLQDLQHKVSDAAEIILDVGVKKQSAIYEEALRVIDRAQEWLVITCQFFPHSTTAQHLKQAHDRGVRVIPIFNHYKAHSLMSRPVQYGVRTRERLRMPASFFDTELAPDTRYLHAKLIATEREAIIGSHNYIPEGINFGTAEIALHNKTAAFSHAAVQLIVEEVGLKQSPSLSFLFD
jgi:phosphatidylserine/phosphatidylglycerophosphate/cardiolipin synthase-like enzyme